MSHEDNVSRIKTVCHALGDLKDQVVFVGGSTVSFYADRETLEVRKNLLVSVRKNGRSVYPFGDPSGLSTKMSGLDSCRD